MEQGENLSKNSKELCLVVLGTIESGKTSLIRSLLGQTDIQQGKRTTNCIRHHGQLNNKRLTVVDTPGWWNGYPLIDTARRTKDELVLSVRQCPHIFILAIEVRSLIERNLRSVMEHLGLLGDDIWGHTIVVFTRGESLNKTIEEHIKDGETLKLLVEKCGNRYCVVDEKIAGHDQIIQLLEKIEALIDRNGGRHFQMNEETLREVDERKRDAQQKASERQLQVQEKRKHLSEQGGGIPSLPEVRIVMLGWVVSGKTAARNVILNKDKDTPLSKTERCERETGSVGGRQITVVDTPGWWKYFPSQYTPGSVETELKKSVSFGSKSPHALLLVVPADVSFLEEQRKITEENMKRMFGEMAWKHTIVLFSWWDSLGNTSIEEHIETEGEPLRWLMEKCGNRYHVLDIVNRGDGSQVRELLQKIDELEASLDFCDVTQETPNTEITRRYEAEDQTKPEMGKLVEKEWSRRDRELEERVKALWQDTFGSNDSQKDRKPVFHENDLPMNNIAEKRIEEKGRVDLGTKSSDVKHTLSSENLPQHGDKKIRHETFEREWGRCKTEYVDRIRGILFRGTQAEHERHKCKKEEWDRHEAVVMGRVETIISEICSKSVFSSEPDEEERKQAVQKVLMWRTTTSGFCSGSDPEDYDIRMRSRRHSV